MVDKMARLRELTTLLNKASRHYYQLDDEIMSNREYDALYDELVDLERETGTSLSGSPTQNVGYEVISELPKREHEQPMLSLDKTKSVAELEAFIHDKEGLLSWKLDGLTVVLTYEQGRLQEAVTRGNGFVGEVITPNARHFKNIPLQISFDGKLVLRGEAVISYEDFKAINDALPAEEERYRNPRNLCSGSVRQLDSAVTAARRVRYYVFAVVEAAGVSFDNSHARELDFVQALGFETVPTVHVNRRNMHEEVENFFNAVARNPLPSDGLVLLYDDIAYGTSLGRTAKFPRNAIAFKWADDMVETTLRDVKWSPSRTGLLNPIALFDPVEIAGTTVSRASLHNVSILQALALGIGDRIHVYKANMIIPQVFDNLTQSDTLRIPSHCPACDGPTAVQQHNDSKELYCTNPACPVKIRGSMVHYVSRDAMNVDGLSEKRLDALLQAGIVRCRKDLYHLASHKEDIVGLPKFGEKSYENLVRAIDASRQTTPARFLYALGIDGIGIETAKMISTAFSADWTKITRASKEAFEAIEGIGPVLASNLNDFFGNTKNRHEVESLREELRFTLPETSKVDGKDLSGKTFVITGTLMHWPNRKALTEALEARGAKVTGSVSKNTDYLINNDATSTSTKNKRAMALGVPILTEAELVDMM